MLQLTNHPDLALCLSSEDHAVLGYLKELTVEDFPDIRSGHTISMVSDKQYQAANRTKSNVVCLLRRSLRE